MQPSGLVKINFGHLRISCFRFMQYTPALPNQYICIEMLTRKQKSSTKQK